MHFKNNQVEYSDQQLEVIHTDGDMVVNAIAGSGKTSTLAAYARQRPRKRILYLAFNSSVRQEAVRKFQQLGISNVRVETAHSLALGSFRNRQFQIYQGSYQPYDLKQLLGFRQKDAAMDMRFGKHVLQMAAAFCNSAHERVADLEYQDICSPEDRAFVGSAYDTLLHQARRFLGMMKSGEAEMTHDFYLKLYQLQRPDLGHYDCILFDEGQDASPVMLDVFLRQKGHKVIVGDEHQQIYGWRYAVNALKLSEFSKKYLETSYRFDQHVGDLAKSVLSTKNLLEETRVPEIKGKGRKSDLSDHATLGRTNGAILVDVIEKLVEEKAIQSVYFEGHFNSYTYADEGGSVYDVLNLYTGNRRRIKNPMVKQFKDFVELQEYVDKSGDAPMKGILDIVLKYKQELPSLIKRIKDSHVDHDHKKDADMVYSTVHKAKGMEYGHVHLLNGFLGEEKLNDLLSRKDPDLNTDRLLEDINILYVAVTRTQNSLSIPSGMVPLQFDEAGRSSIKVQLPLLEDGKAKTAENDHPKVKGRPKAVGKKYTHEQVRKEQPSAYKGWTDTDDAELEALFAEQVSVRDLAVHFGRTKGAISSRIKRLGLREKYFEVGQRDLDRMN